jgi:acetylornithine deacetylase/succinyl-diaminopimelate desuccinylase-like protein
LNIDALAAGQADGGADPATLIPRRALAHADLRLVPGMTVDGTLALLRAHLDRRGFTHVAIEMKAGYPASKTSPREPVVAALLAACRRHGENVTVFPIHAGAAPMYVFSDIIGRPFAFGGLGHGLGAHAANEYLSVESLRPYFRSIASFLFEFAERARRR